MSTYHKVQRKAGRTMVHILTATSQPLTYERSQPRDEVMAEALFASTMQPSECPGAEQIRRAVAATLLHLGSAVCAEKMAAEFGDHPDAAAARMTWAVATIHEVYRAGVEVAHAELARAS